MHFYGFHQEHHNHNTSESYQLKTIAKSDCFFCCNILETVGRRKLTLRRQDLGIFLIFTFTISFHSDRKPAQITSQVLTGQNNQAQFLLYQFFPRFHTFSSPKNEIKEKYHYFVAKISFPDDRKEVGFRVKS